MSNTLSFALNLGMAVAGPVLALRYLQPLLLELLRAQCPEGGQGAAFWMRSAYVMAVCGTLLLMLSFGQYRGETFEAEERALWLVAAGVFGTVAFIARQAWAPVREARQTQLARLRAAEHEALRLDAAARRMQA